MKIWIFTNGLPSSDDCLQGIFELDQARALAAKGHDVVALTVDTRSVRHWRKWGFCYTEEYGIPVYCVNLPLGRLPFDVLAFFAQKQFARLYEIISKKHGKPDVVHAHFTSSLAATWSLCKKMKIPLVFTEHSSHANIASAIEQKNQRDRELYSCANRMICVSHGLANNIQQRTGISSVVVPNIVDVHSFSYNPQNHENFVFVATGNLIPTKGMDLLLRSFSHLPNNCRLIIIGDGKERFALEQQAKDLQISERVIFKGILSRQEINQIYSQCDVFVLASHSETFGVSFIEAMIAGLPVIATCCGGPEDFVDSENGILVPVNDEKALSDAMQQMMQQIDTYDKKRISEDTHRRFSPETIATQLTEIYKEVLSC